jgi:hypothetical protein
VDALLAGLTPEELAKHKPSRVAVFVEPSPFTCALPPVLLSRP